MVNTPKPSKKIRKGDRVVAIAGNNRGQMGEVLSIEHTPKGDRVIVQGLNKRKRHVKKTQQTAKGQIIEIEAPIHVSNLKVCVEGDFAAKLKVRTSPNGDREYIYNKDGQNVVYRTVKKPK